MVLILISKVLGWCSKNVKDQARIERLGLLVSGYHLRRTFRALISEALSCPGVAAIWDLIHSLSSWWYLTSLSLWLPALGEVSVDYTFWSLTFNVSKELLIFPNSFFPWILVSINVNNFYLEVKKEREDSSVPQSPFRTPTQWTEDLLPGPSFKIPPCPSSILPGANPLTQGLAGDTQHPNSTSRLPSLLPYCDCPVCLVHASLGARMLTSVTLTTVLWSPDPFPACSPTLDTLFRGIVQVGNGDSTISEILPQTPTAETLRPHLFKERLSSKSDPHCCG